MTEAKHPLRAFLYYAQKDKSDVDALYARLTEDGIDARLDTTLQPQDEKWEAEFRAAVREIDVVIVCLSRQFNKSKPFQRRSKRIIDIAREASKDENFIKLVRLEDYKIPDPFDTYPAVDLFQANGYESLVNALKEQEQAIGLAQPGKALVTGNDDSKKNIREEADTELQSKRWWIFAEAIGLVASILAVVTFLTGRENIAQFFQGNILQPAQVSIPSVTEPPVTLTVRPEQTRPPIATLTHSPTPIVFTKTITPTPEPGYTLVDPEEVLNIAPNLRSLGQLAIEKYDLEQRNKINNTLTFTINSSPDVPILWRWFWCALNDRLLEQNMTKINIIFDADGTVIPEEQLATVVFENADPTFEGWKCLTYETVMRDWKPGTYVFTQTMTISQAINDGRDTFESGYKIYEYTVNISP